MENQKTLSDNYKEFLEGLELKYSPGEFTEQPVDIVTFFKDWVRQPIYEAKEEPLRSFLEPGIWNTTYDEYLLLWGKGCIDENTVLIDEATGKKYTVKQLVQFKKSILVKSLKIDKDSRGRTKFKFIKTKANVPFKKGTTELFKVKTKSGKEIIVSKEHKFFTKKGWLKLNDLKQGDRIAINSTTVINEDIERKRKQKISKKMKGIKKTKLHKLHIKNSANSSKWIKGNIPWNKNKKNCFSEDIIRKIKKSTSRAMLKIHDKLSKIHKGKSLKEMGHKDNCKCPWCQTQRNGAHTIWYRTKYKNINMRSSWEAKYAKYLDKKNIKWLYESKRFNLGKTSYTPDFYLSETDEYIEIKGFYTKESRKKIQQFKEQYPDIKLIILHREELQELGVLC